MNPYEIILKNSFSVRLNMGDTFHYASADDEEFELEYDLEDIIPVVEEFDHDALIAYAALQRGYDPMIPQIAERETFIQAKLTIIQLMKDDNKFLSLKDHIKERENT